jgi:hypothetical protein
MTTDLIAGLLDRWGVVLATTLAAVPVCVLAVVVWARRRADSDWRPGALVAGIVLGTAPWTWMALTALHGPERVSLTPLVDLVAQVRGDGAEAFVQIFSNMAFLLPLGALAPLRWRALASVTRVLLVAAGYATTIEIAQHALHLGRISSVDDVLQNTAGAVIGALLTRRWWRRSGATATPDSDAGSAVDGSAGRTGHPGVPVVGGQRGLRESVAAPLWEDGVRGGLRLRPGAALDDLGSAQDSLGPPQRTAQVGGIVHRGDADRRGNPHDLAADPDGRREQL